MPAITFPRFEAELLALYQPPLRKPATLAKIRQILGEIRSLTGIKKTADLKPPAVAAWLETYREGRRIATLLSHLRTFRTICRYAVHQSYLKSNPFDWRSPCQWLQVDEGAPREDTDGFDRHLTTAEALRILAQADREASEGSWESGRLQALIYTFAFTGMRKMEVLGMRADDISLDDRIVHIRANPRRKLKTRGSAAPLAIAEPLADVLARWLPRIGCEWAFPGLRREGPWLTGGPGTRPLDQVQALGKRAGVAGLTMLSFRHTIGTLAEGWGLGELELQRWLRHTRRRTQDAYRKPDLDNLRGTARKITFTRSG